ncbi:acid protease [Delitschia confertaspora ATCC 74209]|uniref:Acid protease n=1 Tax=Delitschia confertaspora ATCC 74209 TaxID=1513339 RepID=A0A9P4MMQ1_9PLEO|nr:acid protease [Delitschia confertaspora ATCC 74209]
MAPVAFYFAATVLFAQSTVAFNCSKPPIYVDIHKRVVHGTDKFQYGSFIGVGTPAQNQSLWPSLSQNHTSFASSKYCDNSTLKDCSRSTRGNFDATLSQTYKADKNLQSLDVNKDNGSFTGFLARDDIHLYTHFFETDGASQNLVPDSTIEIATSGSISPGIVGMGQTSTLLQSLYDQNLIAGRTYSLYIGSGMDRAGGVVNGSNTFGGFDAGRFTGDVHSYHMDLYRRNPLAVRVKDIVINETPNSKQNISLFDPVKFPSMKSRPDPFTAEITTDQYPLSLPYQLTQNLIKQLSAEKDKDNAWGDDSLKLTKPFNGTLSIILEDDFVITLPTEVVYNASGISPIQDRAEESTKPFYLSVAFLTQVYLMADFDTFQFYLATARQKNNAVMPRTFCPKSTPSPYSPPKKSAFTSQGLIGAVVGGLVGGLSLLAFGACLFVGWRRRKDHKRLERELEKGRKARMVQMGVNDVEFESPPKTARAGFWRKR